MLFCIFHTMQCMYQYVCLYVPVLSIFLPPSFPIINIISAFCLTIYHLIMKQNRTFLVVRLIYIILTYVCKSVRLDISTTGTRISNLKKFFFFLQNGSFDAYKFNKKTFQWSINGNEERSNIVFLKFSFYSNHSFSFKNL